MRKLSLLTLSLMLLFALTSVAENTDNALKITTEDTKLISPGVLDQNITSNKTAPVAIPLKAKKGAPIRTGRVLQGKGGQPSMTLDQFCPDSSLFDQPPTPVTGNWAATISEDNTAYFSHENFNGVEGVICDIHFWGLNVDPYIEDCSPPENPMPFEIIFYDDNNGTPGNVVQVYNPTLPGTPTGELYDGLYELYAYDYVMDSCIYLTDGWISIQGQGDEECWFLWISHGNVGNGYSLENGIPVDYDLNLCLTGNSTDIYGACCDGYTGTCTDSVLLDQCPSPLRWAYNTACVDLNPACGETLGSCCDDSSGVCNDNVAQIACQSPLMWTEGTLCADLYPPCGGPEDSMTIVIFTDDYPEETTWELIDHGTGSVVASGGPLAYSQNLYTWNVFVDYNGCYDFKIYDAYGDGICCDYGSGYYEVYYNSTLMGSNYNWGGAVGIVANIGGGCEGALGACCDNATGNCTDKWNI